MDRINKLLLKDNSVTNLLASVVEQAISDYLTAKLYLYRLEKNDPKIFKSIKGYGLTVDIFKEECEQIIQEVKDFFEDGTYKAIYGNKSSKQVLGALDERFTNEVIPKWGKNWNLGLQSTTYESRI